MTVIESLQEALRLLRESRKHFKSRQVAEARRLIEQAMALIEKGATHDPH